MKITIQADSQEEFDAKRVMLIKKLAGPSFDVLIKSRTKSVYNGELSALSPRRSMLRAQNEMMDFWDQKYQRMVELLKKDIEAIIEG